MKKYTKVLALALALTMLLSMNVFAADVGYTVTATGGSGAAIDEATAKNFDLTAPAADGKMYLLLVLDASKDEGIPTASNILYVNQATASGSTVVFDKVYPSKIADSNIYLAGGPALTKIALLDAEDPEIVKGDVTGEGLVDMADVLMLARYVKNSEKYPLGDRVTNGRITADETVDMADVLMLARYVKNSEKYPLN